MAFPPNSSATTLRVVLLALLLLGAAGCSAANPDGSAGPAGPASTAGSGPANPVPVDPTPTPSPTPTPTPTPTPSEPPEVPGGGESWFPGTRLVGFSGYPGAPALGRMGVGDLDDRVQEMVEVGEDYGAGDRRTVPVLELITTVVHAEPQADDSYRTRIDPDIIADHLAAAREVDGVLLLNIQPGRADMLQEVQHYEEWLSEPDVGIALDPEWAVEDDEVPGQVYGSTSGAELDDIAAWLSELTVAADLPEKVLLYHQLRVDIVQDPEELAAEDHDRVVVIASIDGIGSPAAKTDTYDAIAPTLPDGVRTGFKLFYEEDTAGSSQLMTPDQVMALDPRPDYVLYE